MLLKYDRKNPSAHTAVSLRRARKRVTKIAQALKARSDSTLVGRTVKIFFNAIESNSDPTDLVASNNAISFFKIASRPV